jgi:uncharacterized protein
MITKESVLYNLKHLSQLVFEVTEKCNLNCKYCGLSSFYEGNSERRGENLPFRKAQLIIDYLYSLRECPWEADYPLNIGFYGGEPLLNMRLIRLIVSYMEHINFTKVSYGITTNGMLLDKNIDYLVKNKFQLLISLDGDQFQNSYRMDSNGRESFRRVVRNVKLLQDEFPNYFKKYVQFNAVLHNRNSIEEIYSFIKNQFNKIPFVIPLNKVGVSRERIDEFNIMYRNVSQSFVEIENRGKIESEMFSIVPQIANLSEYIFHNIRNIYNDFNDLIFENMSKTVNGTGTCSPFSKKMFITVDGKILQCERISHDFVLGQITDDHVQMDINNIAEKQNYYNSKCKVQCQRCYFKNNCPQCVYNIQDIQDENSKCSEFCSKKQFYEYIRKTKSYLRENPHYYERIQKKLIRR